MYLPVRRGFKFGGEVKGELEKSKQYLEHSVALKPQIAHVD